MERVKGGFGVWEDKGKKLLKIAGQRLIALED